MDLDVSASRAYILDKFNKQGDFSFMKPEELAGAVNMMLGIDAIYIAQLGDDGIYDEDVVYEKLYKAVCTGYSAYKPYLMRLVDDYMDFLEQYLVETGSIEWE